MTWIAESVNKTRESLKIIMTCYDLSDERCLFSGVLYVFDMGKSWMKINKVGSNSAGEPKDKLSRRVSHRPKGGWLGFRGRCSVLQL